jgi:hypothetical protein
MESGLMGVRAYFCQIFSRSVTLVEETLRQQCTALLSWAPARWQFNQET